MRICFVTHRYAPRTGGVEKHVEALATRLVDRGHDVTVLAADSGETVLQTETRDGVKIRRYHSVHPGSAFYLAPQLVLAVRRANADVVHAHNIHAFPLFFAALGITDERFVATTHYHGNSASRIRDALLSVYRPFAKRALARADAVIAVSDWERDRIAADFDVDAVVVPNGLDVDRFATATPVECDRPYLLTVGRLTEYKGIQHAIRALAELPEYDLQVAGDGPYRDELESMAVDAGVADRVEFLGYVADDDLPGLYAGASAYVSLSSFEAYGMTVAEALAARTPCVVREARALEDWTRLQGCVGVDNPTPATVADAVADAVDCDVDTFALSTWDDVTDRVLDHYRVEWAARAHR